MSTIFVIRTFYLMYNIKVGRSLPGHVPFNDIQHKVCKMDHKGRKVFELTQNVRSCTSHHKPLTFVKRLSRDILVPFIPYNKSRQKTLILTYTLHPANYYLSINNRVSGLKSLQTLSPRSDTTPERTPP